MRRLSLGAPVGATIEAFRDWVTKSFHEVEVASYVAETRVALNASDIVFTPAGAVAATNVQAAIVEVDAEKQPLDADLTTMAGLTATSDNFMQAKSSAWASRTPAQAAVDLLPFIYPVGSIYFSTNSTNPATSLGFGTWAAFGAGQVPVGFLNADPDFGTDEATGGEKTHTLTAAESATLTYTTTVTNGAAVLRAVSGSLNNRVTTGAANLDVSTVTAATTANAGDGAHNNLQPFIVVRMWRRTA